MRFAILSDIHANTEALNAVLADMEKCGQIDRIWCLGDIIDYGPEPSECVRIIRGLNPLCLAGNHDLAAVSRISLANFSEDAAESNRWTAPRLSAEDRAYLESLPVRLEEGDFTLAHASPRDPIWEYLRTTSLARENFAFFQTPFCIIGHSHVPLVFRQNSAQETTGGLFSKDVKLEAAGDRLIINPGSVGQPRDGNPQASYAIYDSQTRVITLRRVEYDYRATQAKMQALGLRASLISRLTYGI